MNARAASGQYVSVIVPTAMESADHLARHLAALSSSGAASIECILVSPDTVVGANGEPLSEEGLKQAYGFRNAVLLIGEDTSHQDAVRLGSQAATGSLLTWLNSDDQVESGAVAKVLAAHAENPESIIYGNSEQHTGNEPLGPYPVSAIISREMLAIGCFISQPAAWIPLKVWNRLGGLRDTYSLAFDHDLWVRAADAGVPFHYLEDVLARIEVRPEARSFHQRTEVLGELARLQIEHFGRCAPSTLTSLWAETLNPSFGYDHIPSTVLRQAPDVLGRISQIARQRGDYSTVRRLAEDMRLWFLSQGISAEVDANGSLSEAARISFIAGGKAPKFAVSLEDAAMNMKEIALIDSETHRPCRSIAMPHVNCVIFMPELSSQSAQAKIKTFNFLAAVDCDARLEAVF